MNTILSCYCDIDLLTLAWVMKSAPKVEIVLTAQSCLAYNDSI